MWPSFQKVQHIPKKTKSGKEKKSKSETPELAINASDDKRPPQPERSPPAPPIVIISVERPDAAVAATAAGRPYKRPSEQARFNPTAYLRDFYTDIYGEPAMTVVLLLMPNIVVRLPRGIRTMLDVGSGPTVHMAMIFRNKVDQIYLSDYAEANVDALRAWMSGKSSFDWTTVKKFIAQMEGEQDQWPTMEPEARAKVCGAYRCDIFQDQVLTEGPFVDQQFDLVTSTFCTEASCTTSAKYGQGIRNITAKIRPGGLLIMAGILQDTWYQYDHQRYHCYYLSEDELFENLEANGMDTEEGKYSFVNHEGIFIVCIRKKILDEPASDSDCPGDREERY